MTRLSKHAAVGVDEAAVEADIGGGRPTIRTITPRHQRVMAARSEKRNHRWTHATSSALPTQSSGRLTLGTSRCLYLSGGYETTSAAARSKARDCTTI